MVNALYPFEVHKFNRNGLDMAYLDEGAGSAVVMVHGNPTWSFYYRNLVIALRGQHRTIAPDHIGCGNSDKPDDSRYNYTLASRIDDLEALLDHLEIDEDITLVVHDWGGMIGMGYAARHPERIARLVILNTAAFHLPASRRFPWQLLLVRGTAVGDWLIRRWNVFTRAAARFCVTRSPLPPDVRSCYLSPYDSYENRIAVSRFVQDIPLRAGDPAFEIVTDTQKALESFSEVPTMICWGEKDFIFDHHFLAEWERLMPHAEVHRFPDSGHYVLEDATTEIVALVRTFLERTKRNPREIAV